MGNDLNSKSTLINMEEMRMSGIECTEESLIHREQLHQVCDIIKERLEYLEKIGYNPNYNISRNTNCNEDCNSCCNKGCNSFIKCEKIKPINDVISIFARRGAGKTTFVKTLTKLVKENRLKDLGIKSSDIMCIDVIEPNQIYNRENFLIRFLASIQDEFEREARENCVDKNNKYLKIIKENLYEALPVIDGIGKLSLYSDWDDSDFLADKYINLAIKAKELEGRFHKYINKILHLINKKALLFILDDSDVNIEKTFEILETIRLYFTSPQIIVIMTGDPSLYGLAVRRNYWNFFNKNFIRNEIGLSKLKECKKEEIHKTICQLEAQYLQKMTKAEHRIVLNTIYEKYRNNSYEDNKNNKNKYSIYITLSQENEGKDLWKIYDEILVELGLIIKDKCDADRNVIIGHLLKLPFRDQYRLLSTYDEFLIKTSIDKNNPISNKRNLAERVLKVFEVYINQNSSDSKRLMERSPIYSGWVMKFLIDNNIVTIGSHMLPNTEDDNLNSVLFALCSWHTNQMQDDKSKVFDFLVRVSFIRQALLILNENGKELDKFVHICHDVDVHKLLGNVHAYLNAKLNIIGEGSKNSLAGILILSKPIEIKSGGIKGNLLKLIQLTTIAADMTGTYMCSFYNIIPCLAELLRINNIDEHKQESTQSDWVRIELEKICQMHTYVEPYKNNTPRETIRIEAYEKEEISKPDKLANDFIENLSNWMYSIKNIWITPFVLDRIFTRTYYTLKDLDLRSSRNNQSIGEIFSNYILAFLNACIVEECIALENTKDIILGYGMDIAYAFIHNYRKMQRCKVERGDSFSLKMIKCPLLKAYVNPGIFVLIDDKDISWEDYKIANDSQRRKNIDESISQIKKDFDNIQKDINSYVKDLEIWNKIRTIDIRIRNLEIEMQKVNISLNEKLKLEENLKKCQNDKIHMIEQEPQYDYDTLLRKIRSLRNELRNLNSRLNTLIQEKESISEPSEEQTKQVSKLIDAIEKPNELSIYSLLDKCPIQ